MNAGKPMNPLEAPMKIRLGHPDAFRLLTLIEANARNARESWAACQTAAMGAEQASPLVLANGVAGRISPNGAGPSAAERARAAANHFATQHADAVATTIGLCAELQAAVSAEPGADEQPGPAAP